MKIHSDVLTVEDVVQCASVCRADHGVDVQIGELVATGSRKRARGLTFKGYALSGRYAANSGVYGADSPRAATWSAWGYLIAELFARDPGAIIGTYDGAADFVAQCENAARQRRDYPDARYVGSAFSTDFLDIVRDRAHA